MRGKNRITGVLFLGCHLINQPNGRTITSSGLLPGIYQKINCGAFYKNYPKIVQMSED
jgi:hypothetical protein